MSKHVDETSSISLVSLKRFDVCLAVGILVTLCRSTTAMAFIMISSLPEVIRVGFQTVLQGEVTSAEKEWLMTYVGVLSLSAFVATIFLFIFNSAQVKKMNWKSVLIQGRLVRAEAKHMIVCF